MFQCGAKNQVDASSLDVQKSSRDAGASPSSPAPPREGVTLQQHKALLEEVELINNEVTAVRKQLWETQDTVKEKDLKIETLEKKVKKLLELREKDEATVKELKEANTSLVEEEAKVREQMDLLKKVLTRSELKAKEYEETIAELKEERDSMAKFGECSQVNGFSLADFGRFKERSESKEEKYKKLLDEAEADIDKWKDRYAKAAKSVSNLQAQLDAVKDPTGAAKQLAKQRRMIDALEQQIIDLELEEMEKEDERSEMPEYDHTVIQRAIFDEDLEGSKLRALIQTMDCRHCRE
jgi:chromosome segregation ATPase